MKERVVVAMSGGVDSSVSAALLKEQGYDVVGVTMHIWDVPDSIRSCCGYKAISDAQRVCAKLDIPFYTIETKKAFEKYVIHDFCAEYQKGRTPNPCIRCNQFIKFDFLLNKAKELKADKIATGHYSIIEYDKSQKRWLLRKSSDAQKDQSYFLYTMTQRQLSKTLFPVGAMKKTEVRTIAKRFELLVADKPDSQEICFIPNKDYPKFLIEKYNLTPVPGLILNTKGDVIGKHSGIIYYTIGQRRRIRIPMDKPLYVLKIDYKDNNIIVGTEDEGYGKTFTVESVHFIGIKQIEKPIKVDVKIRYNYVPAQATIISKDDNVQVIFDKEQWAITPGQAAVFYKDGFVIGGGIIAMSSER